MKRCIYGVDLDPMAVELAKVSLWLDSFIVGAPPSFLDHHLRCGNSLIGTDVRTADAAICAATRAEANGQMDLSQGAGLRDLTALMAEVADRADVTPREVQRSAEDLAAFRVLDEFAHAKSFPGGRTRSTRKKLHETRVPAFDADADLASLVELRAALAEVQARIAATDALIDQVVYRSYGLTEEEIPVVEGA